MNNKFLLLSFFAALLAFSACAQRHPLPSFDGAQAAVLNNTPVKNFSVPEYTVAASSEALSAVQTDSEDANVTVEEIESGEPQIFISTEDALTPPAPVNLGGNGTITILRQDTRERLRVTYREKDGSYNQDALEKINHIMRCSLDGSEKEMAVKLVEVLDAVEDHFGKKGLTLLSGYRTQELNEIIPGAAQRSMHLLGWAADIRVPGYSTTKIKNYGVKLSAGGVGFYPSKGFVHFDVGKDRYWVVKRAPRRRKVRKSKPKKAAVRHTAAKKNASSKKKSK